MLVEIIFDKNIYEINFQIYHEILKVKIMDVSVKSKFT